MIVVTVFCDKHHFADDLLFFLLPSALFSANHSQVMEKRRDGPALLYYWLPNCFFRQSCPPLLGSACGGSSPNSLNCAPWEPFAARTRQSHWVLPSLAPSSKDEVSRMKDSTFYHCSCGIRCNSYSAPYRHPDMHAGLHPKKREFVVRSEFLA